MGRLIDIAFQVSPITFTLEALDKSFIQSVAAVAAGAKTSAEHRANIVITAYPPVANLAVRAIITSGGGEGPGTATLTMDNVVTDADGILTGTFRSGDVIQNATVRADVLSSDVQIAQVWTDKNDPGRWEAARYFSYDQPNPVTYKPRARLGTSGTQQLMPIRGHTMEFVVTKAVFSVWDETSSTWREEVSTDAAVLAQVGSFEPASGIPDSGGGTYTSNLIVRRAQGKILKSIHYDALDEGVYKPY